MTPTPIERAAEVLDQVAYDSPADYPLAYEEATTTARDVFASIDIPDLSDALAEAGREAGHPVTAVAYELAQAVIDYLTGEADD